MRARALRGAPLSAPPLRSPDRAPDEHPTMSTPEPASRTDASTVAAAGPGPVPDPDDRVAPLRGAGVEINGRQVARVVLGIVLATLAVLAVAFTVIGIHNNRQIDQLRNQGVPVARDGHVLPGPARGQRQQRGRVHVPGRLRARRPPLQRGAARHRARTRRARWSVPLRCLRTRRWSHRSPSSTRSTPRRRSSSSRPSCSSPWSPSSSCWLLRRRRTRAGDRTTDA